MGSTLYRLRYRTGDTDSPTEPPPSHYGPCILLREKTLSKPVEQYKDNNSPEWQTHDNIESI